MDRGSAELQHSCSRDISCTGEARKPGFAISFVLSLDEAASRGWGFGACKVASFSQKQLLEKDSAMSHQQVVGMNASVIKGVLEVQLNVHYRNH